MNQTLNFQHQKVTGVSETVNSTETGDTALVVCHYYGIKQVSEAEPLGRAALRAQSPDNDTAEHIPLHPSDAQTEPETPRSSRSPELPLWDKKFNCRTRNPPDLRGSCTSHTQLEPLYVTGAV